MAVKIIDNCCSSEYLNCLKFTAINSENWNLKYGGNVESSIEDKFPKLNIVDDKGVRHPYLAGLALGLLFQIYEAGAQGLFVPELLNCGISIKDKHSPDNIHTDEEKNDNFVKILGIINSDWEEEWGGGFFHDGTSNYIKPTSFCIFDPSELHAAEEIFTDKKRFAIDFSVHRDQQSKNNWMKKIGNK